MLSKFKQELTIKEAADYLGVSERMVLNYINAKEIAALKVAKRWFIKKPSIDAFKQNYGFRSLKKTSVPQEQSPQLQIPQNTPEEVGKSCLKDLAVFRIIKDHLPSYQSEIIQHERLTSLVNNMVEALGAGYYSFNRSEKYRYYKLARSSCGSLLAQISLLQSSSNEQSSQGLYLFLEQKLMPAFSALIKYFEIAPKAKEDSQKNNAK